MPCKTIRLIQFLTHDLPLCACIGLLIVSILSPDFLPVWVILLFWGLLGSSIILFPVLPRFTLLLGVIILCVGSLQLSTVGSSQVLQLGFIADEIVQVSGSLRFDSSYSANGNTVLALNVKHTQNKKGDSASASGSLQAIVGGQQAMLEGSQLSCRGTMHLMDTGELLFFIDQLSVEEPQSKFVVMLHAVRFNALTLISQRLDLLESPSSVLLKALLLGQRTTAGADIRQMTIQSGCAHVLALSGMHLHCLVILITTLLSLVLGRRRSQWFAFPIAFCYVLVVGCKPSLVRALVMIGIVQGPWRLSFKQVLTLTCIVQSMLFPWTISSIGALLSYSTLTAIICFAHPLATKIALILPPKLALLSSTTLIATLCSAPLALFLFGSWYPIGIIVSPLVALIALLLLASGLGYLVFPFTFIAKAVGWLSYVFMQLCRRASDFTCTHPELGTLVPLLWGVGLLLTVVGILKYAGLVMHKRSKKAYDMGFSLRFPPRDN